MNSRTLTVVASILAFIALLIVIYFAFDYRVKDALLEKMALLHPGLKLDSVRSQLGAGAEYSNLEEMVSRGAVKDRDFCAGKKLYCFDSGPPWSVLEVYTDQDDKIVYVTWQTL